MKKQRGSTLSVLLLVIFWVFWLLWIAYDFVDAPATDVKAVVVAAESSADAQQAVKEFLSEHPTPSNSELRHLSGQVNELVVRDTARAITGDQSLKSSSEKRVEASEVAKAAARAKTARLSALTFSEVSRDDMASWLAVKVSERWKLLVMLLLPVFLTATWISFTRSD